MELTRLFFDGCPLQLGKVERRREPFLSLDNILIAVVHELIVERLELKIRWLDGPNDFLEPYEMYLNPRFKSFTRQRRRQI